MMQGADDAIRVYIVEDHPYMREMLRQFLELEADIRVCGMAETAETALMEISDASPHVVIVDISLPDMNGLDLVETLSTQIPAAACMMLTGHGERSHIRRARSAGAKGYLLKGDSDRLTTAIRHVAQGKTYFAPLDDHGQSARSSA